jgi:hypothetical protein
VRLTRLTATTTSINGTTPVTFHAPVTPPGTQMAVLVPNCTVSNQVDINVKIFDAANVSALAVQGVQFRIKC